MKEKRFWWRPSKPLQSNIKSRHPQEKKLFQLKEKLRTQVWSKEKLSTVTYAVSSDSAFVVKQPLSLHLNPHRLKEEGN